MSKITEKESEQSQSFVELNPSPLDKQYEDQQKFVWSDNKDDTFIDNKNRPYAYNQEQGLNQPLLSQGVNSSSLGNLRPSSEKESLKQNQKRVGISSLNFSKIKPQFYKYNQTPKQSKSGATPKTSLTFLTLSSMLDDPDDEPEYLKDEELQELKHRYNQEYDQYYKK